MLDGGGMGGVWRPGLWLLVRLCHLLCVPGRKSHRRWSSFLGDCHRRAPAGGS